MDELKKTISEVALTSGASGDFDSGNSTGFEGWLLKFGDGEFPLEYIAEGGYNSTPNQRQEVKAWQDNGGNLHRNTAKHYRTKIEIETMEDLTIEEKQEIQSIMNSAITDKRQRKGKVLYWNDEENTYKSATVYIPDVQFKIKKVDREKKKIYYSSIRFALIEY